MILDAKSFSDLAQTPFGREYEKRYMKFTDSLPWTYQPNCYMHLLFPCRVCCLCNNHSSFTCPENVR